MENDLTGAALHRHEKRVTAVMALESLGPQDAATICAWVLDEISAGSPRLDTWGDIRSDIEFHMELANPRELEVYFISSLKRLRNQSLGIHARNRLFMAQWTNFPDADRNRLFMAQWASFSDADRKRRFMAQWASFPDADHKAFLARVYPSEVAA